MGLPANDIAEITQLYALYNHAVDSGDGDRFAACFVPEGTLAPGGDPMTGSDALAAFARGVPAAMPGIRHLAANVLVSGDGDQASGSAYLTVLIAGAQPQVLMTGRYQDSLRREDGAWRFVRRDFDADR